MSFPHLEDNYLPENEYSGHFPTDLQEFSRFTHSANGQYYFAYVPGGNLVLRSEGYLQETSRENGIASVLRNMNDDANYRTYMLPDSTWVLQLYAPNLKEIARSPRCDSEAAARMYLPSARAAAAKSAMHSGDPAKEDNYLACKDYDGHDRSTVNNAFTSFEKDGEYYFTYTDVGGQEVLLRSEGYKTPEARANGIESVWRNKGDHERYRVEEKLGFYFVVLTAPNHKEIARSCPMEKSETEGFIRRLIGFTMAHSADPAKEDNYLACKEYDNQTRSNAHKQFSTFEQNGEYYFAYLGDDGDVLLRSEGYQTMDARENGMQSVLRNKGDRDRYKIEEKLGYYFVILTAPNHKEIARSCPLSEAAALALIPILMGVIPVVAKVAPAVVAAPLVAEPEKKGGMGWLWWLLPLLLLLLLFLLWRGCKKEEPVVATPPPVVPDTTVQVKPAEPPPAPAIVCDWHPVLFETAKYAVHDSAKATIQRVVNVLKENPSFTARFIGNTDIVGSVEYNVKLAQNRAEAVKSVAVSLGADANRISTVEKDIKDPVATNTVEAGRRYNRRVVMYVYDANQKLVCEDVEYDVPDKLEAK